MSSDMQQALDDANMDELIHKVVQCRAGGAVERCHGIKHHGSYSNAAHQWGVAMLLHYLYPQHWQRVVLHALTHDVPEFIWGDVPAPTMRYVPGVATGLKELEQRFANSIGLPGEAEGLSKDEYRALKSCDRLELYLWCMEQRAMGNHYAKECAAELHRYFTEEDGLDPVGLAFYNRLRTGDILPKQTGVAKQFVG
jgi:hypothetical protein